MTTPQLECIDCMTAAATGEHHIFRTLCPGCQERAFAELQRRPKVQDLTDPMWFDTLPVPHAEEVV
jgi:hypothetical protein